MTRVLHVPYTYFPDPVGGTEVYVGSLCAELAGLGFESRVAAPAAQGGQYRHDGVEVHRFATMPGPGIDQAWKAADLVAAEGFDRVLEAWEPEIVHLHARTAAVSSVLAGLARRRGAKVVLTYHSPTMSCARGTMLYAGIEPCEGDLRTARCVRCALGGYGAPRPLAALAASRIGVAASRAAGGRLRIPGLIDRAAQDFRELLGRVDHVVAVCDWVREVLLRNGAVPEHLTLCRQGVARPLVRTLAAPLREAGGPLRMAYYGRVDPAKGVDLLVDAVLGAKSADVTLDLYIVDQTGDAGIAAVRQRGAADARITVRPPLPPSETMRSMATYDLIAVPSGGMETGPLVVLEAQAAGVPVLGAKRGGIAELVRDGVDGMLIAPADVSAWSGAIQLLTRNHDLVRRLQSNVQPPRTMDQVAAEMAALYGKLLADAGHAQVMAPGHSLSAEAAAL